MSSPEIWSILHGVWLTRTRLDAELLDAALTDRPQDSEQAAFKD